MKKSFQVVTDGELWKELKAIAAREGKTIGEKFTELIKAEIDKPIKEERP